MGHGEPSGPTAPRTAPRVKLGDSLKKALVLGLSLFASSGASAVEEISKRVLNTQCRCDVWEVCCAPDSGLTQACLDAGLRAERYTIENGYDMRKRSTGVTLATKAKEVKVKKVWASPPCTDFSQILNLTQNEEFRKNLPRRQQETRAIVRGIVLISSRWFSAAVTFTTSGLPVRTAGTYPSVWNSGVSVGV